MIPANVKVLEALVFQGEATTLLPLGCYNSLTTFSLHLAFDIFQTIPHKSARGIYLKYTFDHISCLWKTFHWPLN